MLFNRQTFTCMIYIRALCLFSSQPFFKILSFLSNLWKQQMLKRKQRNLLHNYANIIFAKYCPVKIKYDAKYHGYDNFTLVSGFILYFIVCVTGQNYIRVKIFQLCLPLVDSQFPSSPIPNYLSAIQTFTENNSYSFFWTHLIFNSVGHHELSGSDQISQSYFSVT